MQEYQIQDGKDNELIVSREEIGTYDQYIREDFVTNPGLQNALIKFFQEYRKPGDSTAKAAILRDKEADLRKLSVMRITWFLVLRKRQMKRYQFHIHMLILLIK